MPQANALQISPDKTGPALTPQQKRFNTLIRQIERSRQTLREWHDNIGPYGQAHAQVLVPLQDELLALRKEWAFALDAALEQHKWTKTQRETLSELVCDAAGELLYAGVDDEALKALFAKHAEVDFETEQQQRTLDMKNMAEAMTGLDLGDDEGLDTGEDLFERIHQGFQAKAAAEEEAEHAAKAAPRRKSAAQQKREADAQQATQSVREIFRKLASALHPDRETDAGQRDIKTALMQKVNQAYAANDLLTLLELQLQVEQIDMGHIASTSVERLKHYNKVLSEQLEELKIEVSRMEMNFRIDFSLGPGPTLDPRKLSHLLEQNSRALRADLEEQRRDIRMLADPASTKRWLKQERQLRDKEDAFDFPFF